jgi:hypothetical protein
VPFKKYVLHILEFGKERPAENREIKNCQSVEQSPTQIFKLNIR